MIGKLRLSQIDETNTKIRTTLNMEKPNLGLRIESDNADNRRNVWRIRSSHSRVDGRRFIVNRAQSLFR